MVSPKGPDGVHVSVQKDQGQKELETLAHDFKIDRPVEGMLYSLADSDSPILNDQGNKERLIAVLQRDAKALGNLLHYKRPRDYYSKPAIHQAILKDNLLLLDCILSLDEARSDLLSDVSVEIVAALRTKDKTSSSFTCLHAAIRKNLPCVLEMVRLCALVEYESSKLQEVITRRGLEDWKDEVPESIFLMRDDNIGNTPLHLLMDSLRSSMTVTGHYQTQQDGSKSAANLQYHPMKVVSKMEEVCITGKATMCGLWAAVNSHGNSPYKHLEEQLEGQLDGPRPHNKTEQIMQDCRDQIRTKVFDSVREIPLLKRALYGTKDMSDFNRSSHNFELFVSELTTSPQHVQNRLLFEDCLVSVFLPDLNTFKKTTPYEAVNNLFEWLNGYGGVKRIKSLNIPDNITAPMSDELVSKSILERFEIERLVWRKPDINLDVLISSPYKDVLTDITLYSTGNYSVLYHWVSADGIGRLLGVRLPSSSWSSLGSNRAGFADIIIYQLRNVTIEIMAPSTVNQPGWAQKKREEAVKRYYNMIKDMLKERKREKGKQGFHFTYNINLKGQWDCPTPQFIAEQPDEIEQLELIQQLQACHDFLGNMCAQGSGGVYDRYKQRFGEHTESSELIKVAIIDNGADKFRQRIRKCIERGVSYVNADKDSPDRLLPWWMVSDPHGTQMASLVAAANPWCRLYIARVGKGRRDILPEDAVQAVKWAIEQKVDVISISWITRTPVDELKRVVEEAAKHTLVFCSTADKGTWSGSAFPADYKGTVRVSATDKYGNFLPASDKGGLAVDVHVPGEDIPAFGPSYMGEDIAKGSVSGSSVATALAAGIASLSLLMLLVFNETSKDSLRKVGFYKNKNMASLLSMAIKPTNQSHLLFPRGSAIKKLPEKWNLDTVMEKTPNFDRED